MADIGRCGLVPELRRLALSPLGGFAVGHVLEGFVHFLGERLHPFADLLLELAPFLAVPGCAHGLTELAAQVAQLVDHIGRLFFGLVFGFVVHRNLILTQADLDVFHVRGLFIGHDLVAPSLDRPAAVRGGKTAINTM